MCYFSISGQFAVNSGEWKINNVTAYEERQTFACCPYTFSTITYSLELERISLYYFLYILAPLIALSFLFLVVFHIPPESGERMGYGITVLLSLTVYLLVISEKLPEKSDSVPILGTCFLINFYLLCTSLAFSAATALFSQNTTPVPRWLIRFRNALRCCCRFKRKKNKVSCITTIFVAEKEVGASCGNLSIKKEPIDKDKPDIKMDSALNDDEKVTWQDIMRFVDKVLFFIFLFLMILTPIIVIACLVMKSTTGLAVQMKL